LSLIRYGDETEEEDEATNNDIVQTTMRKTFVPAFWDLFSAEMTFLDHNNTTAHQKKKEITITMKYSANAFKVLEYIRRRIQGLCSTSGGSTTILDRVQVIIIDFTF
jgi:hypothetical protein